MSGRRRRRRPIWPWTVALALVVAGAYGYYRTTQAQTAEEQSPTLQTTTVRRGDIAITAAGRGEVVAATELALGFKGGGLLTELNVVPGDVVTAGQQLARLDDTDARRQVRQAEIALELAELRQAETLKQQPTAEARRSAALQVEQAQLSLEQAEAQLAATALTAPQGGVVTRVNAARGDSVGASAIVAIADVAQPLVRFGLEESDLDKAVVGAKTRTVLDAYPDQVFDGTVTRIEPVVATVQNVPVVYVWSAITLTDALPPLLIGLSAEVEVVVGESFRTLLVPVQALRELAPEQFGVFVVEADGALRLTPVEVGLRDFANAEILSGLQGGDVVSTGTVEAP